MGWNECACPKTNVVPSLWKGIYVSWIHHVVIWVRVDELGSVRKRGAYLGGINAGLLRHTHIPFLIFSVLIRLALYMCYLWVHILVVYASYIDYNSNGSFSFYVVLPTHTRTPAPMNTVVYAGEAMNAHRCLPSSLDQETNYNNIIINKRQKHKGMGLSVHPCAT